MRSSRLSWGQYAGRASVERQHLRAGLFCENAAGAPRSAAVKAWLPHTPIADPHQTRIECPGCEWHQLLDEDLHEGYTAALIAWHQANPEQGIDHLRAEGLQNRLGIAEYVRWSDDGLGRLVLGDQRTEQAAHFNHECLAIMESVHSTSGLTQAVQRTRHRLDLSRSQAAATVVDLALILYRKGLLIPAPSASDQPRT